MSVGFNAIIMNQVLQKNASILQKEFDWLKRVIEIRLSLAFFQECEYKSIWEIPLPDHTSKGEKSQFEKFLDMYEVKPAERLIFLLALAPHIKPELLDGFYTKNLHFDKSFTEFGGIKENHHSGFIPTGETALFLLAGDDLSERFTLQGIFDVDHYFAKNNILKLQHTDDHSLFFSGKLSLSQEYIDLFSTGKKSKPNYSAKFPAKLVTTLMDWDDIVLSDETFDQINEIYDWLKYGQVLLQDMGLIKKLKPGYKCLFYGPPGTGKTMAATLLGKSTQKDVYRIDLSQIISKYIGETEKNLAGVFDMAENKDWILFFDEADALFGKRTDVKDSHDRYGNQEVAYLLQRIEDFPGLVILASNLKDNIDNAFMRRFHSIVHFPLPGPRERQRLWEKSFSPKMQLEETVNLREIAQKYELTGGWIMNIVRYSSIKALKNERLTITLEDIEEGILKEYKKNGIILV